MERLPPSLLTHICTFLPDPETCTAASLTSKSLHAATRRARPSIIATWFIQIWSPPKTHPSDAGSVLAHLLNHTDPVPVPSPIRNPGPDPFLTAVLPASLQEYILVNMWDRFAEMHIEEALMPIRLRIARNYISPGHWEKGVRLLLRIYYRADGFWTRIPPGLMVEPWYACTRTGTATATATAARRKERYGKALGVIPVGLYPIGRELLRAFEDNAQGGAGEYEYEYRRLCMDLFGDSGQAVHWHAQFSDFRKEVQGLEGRYRNGYILLIGWLSVSQLRRPLMSSSRELLEDGIVFRDEDEGVHNDTTWPRVGNWPAVAIMRMTRWTLGDWGRIERVDWVDRSVYGGGLLGSAAVGGHEIKRSSDRLFMYDKLPSECQYVW